MSGTKSRCIKCQKEREGRYTRPKTGGLPGTWGNRHSLPSWWCWTCLPVGEGRDEGEDTIMAKKSAAPPTTALVAPNKLEAATEASKLQKLIPGLTVEVEQLVVSDEDTYAYADSLLGRIRDSRGIWGKVWERIQEKSIQPIRQGLEELYKLNRDVDKPMETLYEAVRGKMKAYKVEEQRRIQAAQDERDRAAAKLQAEADAKARAAAAAATPQLKGRLEAAAQRLTEQATAVATVETPEPVTGQRSGDRKIPSWRFKDFAAFLRGVADSIEANDGVMPAELVLANMPAINRRFKTNPDEMRAWPGIEFFDDVQIVGR